MLVRKNYSHHAFAILQLIFLALITGDATASPVIKQYADCDAHLLRVFVIQPTSGLMCFELSVTKDKAQEIAIRQADTLSLDVDISGRTLTYPGHTSIYYTQVESNLLKIKTTVFCIPSSDLIDWDGVTLNFPPSSYFQSIPLYQYQPYKSHITSITQYDEEKDFLLVKEMGTSIISSMENRISLDTLYFGIASSKSEHQNPDWPTQTATALPTSIDANLHISKEGQKIVIIRQLTPSTKKAPGNIIQGNIENADIHYNVTYLPESKAFDITYYNPNPISDKSDIAICVLPVPLNPTCASNPNTGHRGYRVKLKKFHKKTGTHFVSIDSKSDPSRHLMFTQSTGIHQFEQWFENEQKDNFQLFLRTSHQEAKTLFTQYSVTALSPPFKLKKYRTLTPSTQKKAHKLSIYARYSTKVKNTPRRRVR